jgi:hypothetical protein
VTGDSPPVAQIRTLLVTLLVLRDPQGTVEMRDAMLPEPRICSDKCIISGNTFLSCSHFECLRLGFARNTRAGTRYKGQKVTIERPVVVTRPSTIENRQTDILYVVPTIPVRPLDDSI